MFSLISGICFLAIGVYDIHTKQYGWATLALFIALYDFSRYAGLLN